MKETGGQDLGLGFFGCVSRCSSVFPLSDGVVVEDGGLRERRE